MPQLTPDELATANAQGMTPDEFIADYASKTATRKDGPEKTPTVADFGNTNFEQLLDPARSIVDKAIGTPAQAAYDLGGKDYKPPPPRTGDKTASPESAYEELADAQANQYLAATKAIEPYTSGAAIPSFDESMTSGAEKMLGTSSTSPISQWLNQQVQAAQAQYAPTQAAGATVAQAEQAGEKLEAGGLQQMGQAETALMQTAPYEGLLQSLAADVPYKLFENYNFSSLSKNIPASVQLAESNLGISTAGQGSGGATPLLPAPTAAVGGTPSTSPVSSGNPSIPGG